MKLAWFVSSSVGQGAWRFARDVAAACPPEVAVDIWVEPKLRSLCPGAKVIDPTTPNPVDMSGYDHCLYSRAVTLGDDEPWIFQAQSEAFPGLMVVHGVNAGCRSEESAERCVEPTSSAATLGQALLRPSALRDTLLHARGLVLFSPLLAEVLKTQFWGPVEVLPLLPVFSGNVEKGVDATPLKIALVVDTLSVPVTHVLRELDSWLEAHPTVDVCWIDPWRRSDVLAELQRAVKANRLVGRIRVAEVELSALGEADIHIYFQPWLNEAVWLAASAWQSGAWVIAPQTAHSGEGIPRDGYLSVNQTDSGRGFLQALTRVVEQAETRRRLRQRAERARALTTVTASALATRLLAFLIEVKQNEPALRLVEKVGHELAALHVTPDMPVVKKMTHQLAGFLGDK